MTTRTRSCHAEHWPTKQVAITWSSNDPIGLISSVDDSPWQLVDKSKTFGNLTSHNIPFVSAKGSTSIIHKNLKHQQDQAIITDANPPAKKVRISKASSIISSPLGLIWDRVNYSCGYDSLLVILFDIWKDNPQIWSGVFRGLNRHCALWSQGFDSIMMGFTTFEQVRDNWRYVLHNTDPVMFPRGTHGISVAGLAEEMLKVTQSIASSQHQCSRCEYAENPIDDKLTYVLHADNSTKNSTNTWVNGLSQITYRRCPDCNHSMKQVIFYNEIPNIVILEYPMKNIQTSHTLDLITEKGEIKILNLRGIVYHGGYHFTSRIVSSEKKIWYHDGINTGKVCLKDGLLGNTSEDRLRVCRGRDLVLAVYAQKL